MVRIISTACLGNHSSQFFQGEELDGIDFSDLRNEEKIVPLQFYSKPKKKSEVKAKPIQFGKKIN